MRDNVDKPTHLVEVEKDVLQRGTSKNARVLPAFFPPEAFHSALAFCSALDGYPSERMYGDLHLHHASYNP